MKKEELYEKTIAKYGAKAQLEMAQEEATELALAVRRFIRYPTEDKFTEMASEIADVEIMIEQMRFMFPKLDGAVKSEKEFKLIRLEKRVKK